MNIPDAPVVAHPECTKAVQILADEVCSTEKMVHYCRDVESDSSLLPLKQVCCTG